MHSDLFPLRLEGATLLNSEGSIQSTAAITIERSFEGFLLQVLNCAEYDELEERTGADPTEISGISDSGMRVRVPHPNFEERTARYDQKDDYILSARSVEIIPDFVPQRVTAKVIFAPLERVDQATVWKVKSLQGDIAINCDDASCSAEFTYTDLQVAWTLSFGIMNALSFVLGRYTPFTTLELPDRTIYRNPKRFHRSFYPPVHVHLLSPANLIGSAIDFFMSDEHEDILTHLYFCWQVADSDDLIRAMNAAIALEAVAWRYGTSGKSDAEVLAFAAQAVACLKDCEELKKDEFLLERASDAILNMNTKNTPDRIKESFHKLDLGFDDKLIKSWSLIRNKLAHGKPRAVFAKADSGASLYTHDHIDRIANSVNRLLLKAMGYNGYYINYEGRLIQDRRFPDEPPMDKWPMNRITPEKE